MAENRGVVPEELFAQALGGQSDGVGFFFVGCQVFDEVDDLVDIVRRGGAWKCHVSLVTRGG